VTDALWRDAVVKRNEKRNEKRSEKRNETR